jgi:hypothetical protein
MSKTLNGKFTAPSPLSYPDIPHDFSEIQSQEESVTIELWFVTISQNPFKLIQAVSPTRLPNMITGFFKRLHSEYRRLNYPLEVPSSPWLLQV